MRATFATFPSVPMSASSSSSLDSIARLAREHRAALSAAARAEGLAPEDAVDAVQEAICTMLAKAGEHSLPAAPHEWGPYLLGVVRNTARNRRRLHAIAKPHVGLEVSTGAELRDDEPLAEEALARAEEHVRLRACVAELCEVQRAVVTLRMLEDRAGEDVGRALGISSNHVAVLLLRAKTALRACMTESI
jgi:RNA polymerase sigma-70 factor, ECF subfamily